MKCEHRGRVLRLWKCGVGANAIADTDVDADADADADAGADADADAGIDTGPETDTGSKLGAAAPAWLQKSFHKVRRRGWNR